MCELSCVHIWTSKTHLLRLPTPSIFLTTYCTETILSIVLILNVLCLREQVTTCLFSQCGDGMVCGTAGDPTITEQYKKLPFCFILFDCNSCVLYCTYALMIFHPFLLLVQNVRVSCRLHLYVSFNFFNVRKSTWQNAHRHFLLLLFIRCDVQIAVWVKKSSSNFSRRALLCWSLGSLAPNHTTSWTCSSTTHVHR